MRGPLVSFGVGIVSILMLTAGLSLTPSHGAQPLTDAELDDITAAGSFSIEILPPAALAPPPPVAPAAPIAFQSATAAIQAASAALSAASSLDNQQGVPVATKAVQAASAAIDTISWYNGVGAANSAMEAVQAATSAIGDLNLDPTTASPSILAASESLHTANTNLVQNSSQNGAQSIGAASAALNAASAALEAVHSQNGLDAHTSDPAIFATADAVNAASKAINLASTTNTGTTTPEASQGAIGLNPKGGIDPALLTETPGVVFTFDAGGGTTGSGSAQIPAAPAAAPAAAPGLTFSGNPILSGNAFQVQNMLLNMNICVQCRASGHIVQTGNGFVFPITVQ